MMWSRGAARSVWTAMNLRGLIGLVCWVSLVGLVGCTNTTQPPEPVSFERPTRMAFVCVDTAQPAGAESALVALDVCKQDPLGLLSSYALHALVLQSSRGEVAAVNIPAWRVIDSRPDIPGKTFVPTGEVPVAIVTAPDHPRLVYVANSGSRDISVMRVSSILSLASETEATLQRVRLRPSGADVTAQPFDMLLSPDQDALFVTSRDAGWLLRIPIKRCADATDSCPQDGQLDAENILRIPLEQSWSKLPADAFMTNDMSSQEPYRYTCDVGTALLSLPDTPPPLPSPNADVGAPEPAGLALDAFCEAGADCTRRLLVADAHQPIVHAVDIDKLSADAPADALLPPILTAAPSERVAVTPKVPVDLDSDAATQYVYAIDARDGSVIVAHDGRVENVSVNPAQRSDRLNLGPSLSTASLVALSLEILTPDFDVRGPAGQWVHASQQPSDLDNPLECVDVDHQRRLSERLRGVFLAVGLTDGTVRIINVHDMELRECRSCTTGQAPSFSPFMPGYDPLPVIRNRPRLMSYSAKDLSQPPVLVASVTPQFSVEGASIGVQYDGATNDTRIAGLSCFSCGEKQAISFPPADVLAEASGADAGVAEAASCTGGQGLVCTVADPFVEPRNWQAVYEGPIPGSRGGRGRFVPSDDPDNQSGALEFVGDADFCAVGVLGDDQLKTGDQLVITSPLPTDQLRHELGEQLDSAENDLCNKLVDARDMDQTPIGFGIRQAYAGRLQIGTELATPRATRATWQQVQKCFAGLPLTYQVQARDSFVVLELGATGLRHRVMTAPDSGRCVNDPTQDLRRTGRVRRGELFDNGLISFKPSSGDFAHLTVLSLLSVSNAPKVLVQAGDSSGSTGFQGVMPVDMRFSSVDQQLYIIDITSRGLMRLSLDPLSVLVSASDTIQ